jgi:hypothetical protein
MNAPPQAVVRKEGGQSDDVYTVLLRKRAQPLAARIKQAAYGPPTGFDADVRRLPLSPFPQQRHGGRLSPHPLGTQIGTDDIGTVRLHTPKGEILN